MTINNAFEPMGDHSPQPFHQVRLTGAAPVLLLSQAAGMGVQGKSLHTHPEGQFYFAMHGLIVVETAQGRVIMPPGRVGWIPPMVPHGATVIGSTKSIAPDISVGFTLYLLPALCAQFPPEPTVLSLSGMMREILKRMQQWPQQQPLSDTRQRLLAVFMDEIHAAELEPLRLKMPVSRQLVTLASVIADDPADDTSLEDWGQRLGMSSRTITRRFREETGLSVSSWRQVARLQRALEMLGDGDSVTSVAITLGYESVSSFIALFRRLIGTTPAKFAADIRRA